MHVWHVWQPHSVYNSFDAVRESTNQLLQFLLATKVHNWKNCSIIVAIWWRWIDCSKSGWTNDIWDFNDFLKPCLQKVRTLYNNIRLYTIVETAPVPFRHLFPVCSSHLQFHLPSSPKWYCEWLKATTFVWKRMYVN